jgi:hypothetical protein
MTCRTSNEVTICRSCLAPGHCRGTSCHRCRTVALERFYARLLHTGSLSLALKKVILWLVIEHPAAAFKTKAVQLGAWNMMCLLCRPAFIPHQLDEQVTSLGSFFGGTRFVLFRNYKYSIVRQRADGNSLSAVHFKTTLFWKGKQYDVAVLACFQDYIQLVLSFLF